MHCIEGSCKEPLKGEEALADYRKRQQGRTDELITVLHDLLTGRERTVEEYAELLEGAGWKYVQTWYPASKLLGVVESVKV